MKLFSVVPFVCCESSRILRFHRQAHGESKSCSSSENKVSSNFLYTLFVVTSSNHENSRLWITTWDDFEICNGKEETTNTYWHFRIVSNVPFLIANSIFHILLLSHFYQSSTLSSSFMGERIKMRWGNNLNFKFNFICKLVEKATTLSFFYYSDSLSTFWWIEMFFMELC